MSLPPAKDMHDCNSTQRQVLPAPCQNLTATPLYSTWWILMVARGLYNVVQFLSILPETGSQIRSTTTNRPGLDTAPIKSSSSISKNPQLSPSPVDSGNSQVPWRSLRNECHLGQTFQAMSKHQMVNNSTSDTHRHPRSGDQQLTIYRIYMLLLPGPSWITQSTYSFWHFRARICGCALFLITNTSTTNIIIIIINNNNAIGPFNRRTIKQWNVLEHNIQQ